jgi:hypothetical protein
MWRLARACATIAARERFHSVTWITKAKRAIDNALDPKKRKLTPPGSPQARTQRLPVLVPAPVSPSPRLSSSGDAKP